MKDVVLVQCMEDSTINSFNLVLLIYKNMINQAIVIISLSLFFSLDNIFLWILGKQKTDDYEKQYRDPQLH